ncbi:hypothetical protein ON010_g12713 [Phytophthora cinnamomi]|nr:hypothetical protein ON010_g12713 [Phytophthora cinnamomi]
MESPALQVELEESAHKPLDRCRDARPANTTRDLRAEAKRVQSMMHLFLQEEVVDRKVRTKGSDRKISAATVEIVLLEHEGFTECRALVMIMDQGKTNQFGRREFGSCIRPHNVEVCPVGALGFFFFFRWCVQMEEIPGFLNPAKWYNVKVLKSRKDSTKAMTYRSHYDATVKAFTALGMHSKAKTHAARGSGAKMAELTGATESQIRRLGRWNASAMEGCYLNLLLYLRVVVLQDAALLRDLHPAHKLWTCSAFNANEFDAFAIELKTKMKTEKSPQTMHLHEVVPDLMEHRSQQHQQTLAHIDNKISEVGSSVLNMKQAFTQLTSGSTALRLTVDWSASVPETLPPEAPSHPAQAPPTYKLLRSLKTVHQVWQEWSAGIHGGPAVRDLEERHGAA